MIAFLIVIRPRVPNHKVPYTKGRTVPAAVMRLTVAKVDLFCSKTKTLNSYFQQLLVSVEGLYGIMVTDREGVPLVKVNTVKCPEAATRGSFLSTFATATEQASKLGLSRNKNMICIYPSYQVVIFNYSPLVVTVIASQSANTGMILGLEQEFKEAIEQVKTKVDTP